MKKNQQTSGERTLKLNRETLRAVAPEQMKQANGGSTIHTSTCDITWWFCS
jgi:hypothetical protein